jgi:glycosyltransferase involved in cell wall biosynthesis
MPISVGIPTYNRLDMLVECIESVFSNDYRPIEIIVSDDAHDPLIPSILSQLRTPDGITIHYAPNRCGKGQAANVKNAIYNAKHELFILMHDDDYFVPSGIDSLVRAWQDHGGRAAAVYGRQIHVDHDGHLDLAHTKAHADRRFKNMPIGVQPSALWAALTFQMPNNGALIRRSVVASMPIFDEAQVGRIPVDHHFNINYALHCQGDFILIHDYVSAYRRSEVSVLRPSSTAKADGHLHYKALTRVPATSEFEKQALDVELKRASRRAIIGFAAAGDAREARRLLMRTLRCHRRWKDRIRLPLLVAMSTLRIRIPLFLAAEGRRG